MGDTIRAYAAHLGLSANAVMKMKKSGKLVFEADGTIDRAASDVRRIERTDPSQIGGRGLPPPVPRLVPPARAPAPRPAPRVPATSQDSYHTARAVREGFEARLSELEFRRRAGELVELRIVKRQAFDAARRARDLLLAIPDRAAPLLVGMTDQHEIHNILRGELERAVQELQHVYRGTD